MSLSASNLPGPAHLGRFLHAADLHLGAPLASLGVGLGAEHAAYLRDLAQGAFSRLIEAVVAERAEVLVLAGDVYDQAEREVRAQVRLARGLADLHDAGVGVFVAHGNHDPLAALYRPAHALPPNVTVFQPGRPQVHHVALASGHPLHVAGLSFSTAHERENLAVHFQGLLASGLDANRTVAVLHANVAGSTGHDPYAPCSVEDLAAAPVGYWALGHVHQRSINPLGPGRWWAYSGNLQGRSTKATECGPKGALAVDIVEDGFGEPRFVACDTLRFHRADVDVSTAQDVGDVFAAIAATLEGPIADAQDRPLLARVHLHGSTAAHPALTGLGDGLLVEARRALASLLGDGTITKIDVATRLPLDRAQLLERNDVLSAVLHRLDADGAEALDVESTLARLGGTAASRLRVLLADDPTLAARLVERVESRLVEELAGS